MALFSNIWFILIVLPFLLGVGAQLLPGRKHRRILPVAFSALAVAVGIWASTNPVPGSEGPGLRAIQMAFLAAGAVLTALVNRRK